MPDFKKISRLIQAQAKERYVLVENGVPAWVVLSMEDYEALVRAKEQRKQARPTKAPQALEAALLSYQSAKEEDELSVLADLDQTAQPQDPEIYLEEVIEEPLRRRWGLSTTEEGEEEEEFDTIPF